METINSSLSTRKRIDYLDAIKGIAIFGVVWVHTSHPDWLTLNYIFFILGGFFFKRKSLKIFLREKIQYILLPFLFFYLVSYLFRIVVHYWDYRSLTSFEWGCIFDVFDCATQWDYLFVNVPLWFLLCFFVIQILYYFVSYLNKWLIAILALLCMGLKSVFMSVPTPFMINVACYYIGFFAIGNLIGKAWIEKLKDLRFRKLTIGISFISFLALFVPINTLNECCYGTAYHIKLFMVFFVLMSVFSWLNEKSYLSTVRFYGENSLTILGIHVMPLIVVIRITNAIFGYCTPFMGFIQSVIVMAIMYVVILFCNKYIPMLVGKKVHVRA
ncbi:MAG: acyltransferase family protein [Prevotellamassilia sp.]|nr:acyltransferase family protein [Prevotellamassilia sp.]